MVHGMDSLVQWCIFQRIHLGIDIDPILVEQEFHYSFVLCIDSKVKRRPSINILQIDVGTFSFKEGLDLRYVPFSHYGMQWRRWTYAHVQDSNYSCCFRTSESLSQKEVGSMEVEKALYLTQADFEVGGLGVSYH